MFYFFAAFFFELILPIIINTVFACNGRLIPSVDGVVVKAMYGTKIIEKTKLGTFSIVDSEDMVMNFLSNAELFHTKIIL